MMSATDRFRGGVDTAVLDTAERALITARQAFVRAWRDAYGEEPSSIPCPPKGSTPDAEPTPEVETPADVAVGADADDPDEAARRAELVADQDQVRAEAEELLGRPPAADVAEDLDAHSRAFGPPPDAATQELTRLLTDQGIALTGERVGRGTLIEYADAWLDEQQVVTWRRAELEAELDQIDRDIVRLHDVIAARRDHLAATAAEEALARKQAQATFAGRTSSARQALDELESSTEGARRAEELQELQAELEIRTAEERAAAAAMEQAGEPTEAASDEEVAAAAERLAEAERARDNAAAEEEAASAVVAELEQRVADDTDPSTHDVAEHQVRLDAVDQDLSRAENDLVLAESELEMADQTVQVMIEAESTRRQERARNQLSKGSLLEDIDWYLLARLASQRSVGVAGSLPLVVDDAFSELPATEANWLLGRLERMTGAVQVIVLTDRPESVAWADHLGEDRAVLVVA